MEICPKFENYFQNHRIIFWVWSNNLTSIRIDSASIIAKVSFEKSEPSCINVRVDHKLKKNYVIKNKLPLP